MAKAVTEITTRTMTTCKPVQPFRRKRRTSESFCPAATPLVDESLTFIQESSSDIFPRFDYFSEGQGIIISLGSLIWTELSFYLAGGKFFPGISFPSLFLSKRFVRIVPIELSRKMFNSIVRSFNRCEHYRDRVWSFTECHPMKTRCHSQRTAS